VLRSLTPQEASAVAGADAPADAKPPAPQSTPAKTYGADDRSALDRLFQTNGGDSTPSR
jgi:hypothetical protein